MFGSIGGPELILIFVVALLIFGPRRLSEIGRTLGKALGEFRRAAYDLRNTLDTEVARVESAERRETIEAPAVEHRGASPERDAPPGKAAVPGGEGLPAASMIERQPASEDGQRPDGSAADGQRRPDIG